MENAFTGTLPESWSSLTNLKALAVQNNQIKGPLPPAWSTLKVCVILNPQTPKPGRIYVLIVITLSFLINHLFTCICHPTVSTVPLPRIQSLQWAHPTPVDLPHGALLLPAHEQPFSVRHAPPVLARRGCRHLPRVQHPGPDRGHLHRERHRQLPGR